MAKPGTVQSPPASALLAAISAEGRAGLERHLSRRSLTAGEVLIHRDQTDDDVFVILSGLLRVIIYAPNGRAVLLRDLGPGETIGELAAIDRLPRSASVEARENASVLRIPGGVFRSLVSCEPALAMLLLQRAIAYVRQLSERLYELGSLSAAERIAAELLRLVREAGASGNAATISPAPRHIDIAERLCMSREAVTRELGRLARSGLVEQTGRTLLLKDVRRLSALAGEPESR